MERSASGKPYWGALVNFPLHKEEINQLPRKYDAVLAQYPYKKCNWFIDEEGFFLDLVLCCREAELSCGGSFFKKACQNIDAVLYKLKQEANKLYNPYRNLCLDKCYGEGKHPLMEWMDFERYREETV